MMMKDLWNSPRACLLVQGVSIPKIFGAGTCFDGQLAWIAMENVGTALSALEDQLPSTAQAKAKQAVQALHERNILHGDLSLSNMTWRDDHLFLIDLDRASKTCPFVAVLEALSRSMRNKWSSLQAALCELQEIDFLF